MPFLSGSLCAARGANLGLRLGLKRLRALFRRGGGVAATLGCGAIVEELPLVNGPVGAGRSQKQALAMCIIFSHLAVC